jgi:hypothetical protein
MQPTYNPAPPQANPWQLGPTASRIARWVFGLGFFSVHLGIFLIGGLGLLMLNLYRSPDDLWVGGPLLRWGIVVVIHMLGAIVTWAITTAFDAAEATRRGTVAYEPPRPVRVAPPPAPAVPRINEPAPQPRPRFQPALSTPVDAAGGADRRRGPLRGRQDAPLPTAGHRPSPPGWTVMGPSDTMPPAVASAPAAEPAWNPPPTPARATAPVTPEPAPSDNDLIGTEDSRWTWVEAAAEAWLADRLDKPPSGDTSKETPS